MSKIAIISQPDQGVLIDVGGCANLQEALGHLSSTLQVSSQFWKGVSVALHLGSLELTNVQVAQILALAKGVGIVPESVFAESSKTRSALKEHNVKIGKGKPMTLPKLPVTIGPEQVLEKEDVAGGAKPNAISDSASIDLVYETDVIEPVTGAVAGSANASSGTSVNAEAIRASESGNCDIDGRSADESDNESDNESDDDCDDDCADAAKAKAKKVSTDKPMVPAPPAVLYLRQTLRSGQVVSHSGHLVVVGDVNPGAEILAEGDITVWGSLRGVAHAGIGGNVNSEIRALNLQPVQIRIANAIARSPDRPRVHFTSSTGPEVAKIVEGKIRVSRHTSE